MPNTTNGSPDWQMLGGQEASPGSSASPFSIVSISPATGVIGVSPKSTNTRFSNSLESGWSQVDHPIHHASSGLAGPVFSSHSAIVPSPLQNMLQAEMSEPNTRFSFPE